MGYLDAQAGDGGRTAFRRAEKKYKLYKQSTTHKHSRMEIPVTDLSQVIDFERIRDGDGVTRLDHSDFPVYALEGHTGFFFIPRAVPHDQQFHWIREALTVFPEPPNRTSHSAHYGPLFGLWSSATKKRVLSPTGPVDISAQLCSGSLSACREDKNDEHESSIRPRTLESSREENGDLFVRKWEFADPGDERKQEGVVSATALLRKLRWATLGVQFDWSKRAYDISIPYRSFPPALSELATKLASPAMNGDQFRAEAAIVNFFGPVILFTGLQDNQLTVTAYAVAFGVLEELSRVL
ncbi:alpha-ketoglutarate-dependent dioxygenase alkB [Selaginella moellendorffii]|uniref:alpha-ketoglutarate-dependent dioxygenase alkB n=1 Tax=Selaginella moellendorffii TaxID=88036 RepID=UPI000D1CA531|nr:alpha-ketoglutarate-dependent dioxygenase alkB [Selaginella moellendorffii]|eukprot:XP_024541825.1 alpha-ketoglutarate-dependent dioxygenase alkB [Selaginella moellendorffii]